MYEPQIIEATDEELADVSRAITEAITRSVTDGSEMYGMYTLPNSGDDDYFWHLYDFRYQEVRNRRDITCIPY